MRLIQLSLYAEALLIGKGRAWRIPSECAGKQRRIASFHQLEYLSGELTDRHLLLQSCSCSGYVRTCSSRIAIVHGKTSC